MRIFIIVLLPLAKTFCTLHLAFSYSELQITDSMLLVVMRIGITNYNAPQIA